MGLNQPGSSVDVVEVGAAVIVRTRYLGSWAGGFEVAEVLDDGYRLRRLSDGDVLPDVIEFDDVKRRVAGL